MSFPFLVCFFFFSFIDEIGFKWHRLAQPSSSAAYHAHGFSLESASFHACNNVPGISNILESSLEVEGFTFRKLLNGLLGIDCLDSNPEIRYLVTASIHISAIL